MGKIFSNEEIAKACACPVGNIETYWPSILKELQNYKICTYSTVVSMLATIKTETGTFVPIREKGNLDYFKKYEWSPKLGNTEAGDGYKFRGRGFIQITGRANYARYGDILGVDLISYPDKALDPDVAAKIAVLYFKTNKVNVAADKEDWEAVRRLVNGAAHGKYSHWDLFIYTIAELYKL